MSSTIDTKYFVASHQGLVRDNNEDSYGDVATPHGHVYVVCDGMGGHNAGEEASRLAVQEILKYLQEDTTDNISESISLAIQAANEAIFAAAEQQPALAGMGTTCVVLYCQSNGNLYLGHVGDSRIYLFQDGRLSRITRDHSYVQYLVSTGEITEAEAEVHPSKNQILKALGIDDTVSPEVSATPIVAASGDVFLLCSDGLSDMVADSAIQDILQSYENCSQETVEHLLSEALNAGGKDNVTVGLLQVIETPQPPAEDTPDTTIVGEPVTDISDVSPAPSPSVTPTNNTIKWLLISVLLIVLVASIWWFFLRSAEPSGKSTSGPSRLVIVDSLPLPVSVNENAILTSETEQSLSIMTNNALLVIGLHPTMTVQLSMPTKERLVDNVPAAEGVYFSLGNNKIYRQSLQSSADSDAPIVHITEKITNLHLMGNGKVLANHNDDTAVLIADNPVESDTLDLPGLDEVFVHPGGEYFLVTTATAPTEFVLFNLDDAAPAGNIKAAWNPPAPLTGIAFTNQDSPHEFVALLKDGRAYVQVDGVITDSLTVGRATLQMNSNGRLVAQLGDTLTVYLISDNHLQPMVSVAAEGHEVVQTVTNGSPLYIADRQNCVVSLYKDSHATGKELMLPEGLCSGRLFSISTDLFVLSDNVLYQLNKP